MRIVFILLEALLFFSCNHRQSTELLKIKPIDELRPVIPISDFADSISLYSLIIDSCYQAMATLVLLIAFLWLV